MSNTNPENQSEADALENQGRPDFTEPLPVALRLFGQDQPRPQATDRQKRIEAARGEWLDSKKKPEDLATKLPGRMRHLLVRQKVHRADAVVAPIASPGVQRCLAGLSPVSERGGSYDLEIDGMRPRDIVLQGTRTGGTSIKVWINFNWKRLDHAIFTALSSGGKLTNPDDRFGMSDFVTLSNKFRVISLDDKNELNYGMASYIEVLLPGLTKGFYNDNQHFPPFERSAELDHEGTLPIDGGGGSVYNRPAYESDMVDGESIAKNGRMPTGYGRYPGWAWIEPLKGFPSIVTVEYFVFAKVTYREATQPIEYGYNDNGWTETWQNVPPNAATERRSLTSGRPEYDRNGVEIFPSPGSDIGQDRTPIYTTELSYNARAFSNRPRTTKGIYNTPPPRSEFV